MPQPKETAEEPTVPDGREGGAAGMSAAYGPEGGAVGMSALRFRVAVLRHHKLAFRIAYALLGDRHEAEDVAQEAFLKFWQEGNSVRREREWLAAVVRNASLDRLRRRRPTVDVDAAEALTDTRAPDWHLQNQQLAARLEAGIAALPEPQRSLIVLFDVQGFDGAACARVLGLSANQVKVYLHRARRRLRRELEGP